MSCYIVPDEQVILIAALHWQSIDLDAVCDIADLLLKENHNSYNVRYMRDDVEVEDRSKVTEEKIDKLKSDNSPIQVLKYCQNYIYQSDNHEGWKTSKARGIVDSVMWSQIIKLEGYDAAKWDMD